MNLTLDKARLPSTKFKRRATYFSVFSILMVAICIWFGFNPLLFITDFHYFVTLFQEMTPPNFSILARKPQIFSSILETVAMAFLGTLIGGSISLVLSFGAAYSTTPHPWLRTGIRLLFSIERAIPSLVIILIFLIAVGLGPFAGMLTLAVSTVGTFGKLFADALEHVDEAPLEAIYAVGAKRVQAIRFGIIPQVLPSFIANFFYAFDVNLRAAIGLGIFGGGGIGFEIQMAMKVMQYRDAMALIFFTIILISLFEKISDFLRQQILGHQVLK